MADPRFSTRTLDSPTGAALNLHMMAATGPDRGVCLILHGLAEHSARYAPLARHLSARGIHAYAHDHRGHGSTSARDAPLRKFAGKNGAAKVVEDCRAILRFAREQHPGRPVVVFGHSMGGLIALNFAERFGEDLAGLCVWNSDFRAGWELRVGRAGLAVEKALKGSDVASELFRRAMFGAWAKAVPDRRTEFDWLSHSHAAVDAYVSDPLCGFTPTVSMMNDIIALITQGGSAAGIDRLPASLPVHLLGGSEDPVTDNGAAMHWLAGRLRERGMSDVTLKIVEGARHETLNETEPMRGTALAALDAFLDRVLEA